MSNELSELQAVDFAIGDFISKAFDGLSLTTGPKEWREFLGRSTAAQIYRHDAASPSEFVKALQASRKAETGTPPKRDNSPPLPAVYYYRKPGFSNVNDRSKQIRGRYLWNDALLTAYQIRLLHLDLDYTLVFVAADKPTLDKMAMAWYAYIVAHDSGVAKFRVGSDIFDVPVTLQDHCNLTISDASEVTDNGRLLAATTNYTAHTMILFGAEIPPPPTNIRIQYGTGLTEKEERQAGIGNGIITAFSWSDGLSGIRMYQGQTITGFDVLLDGVMIAKWNGNRLVMVAGSLHTVSARVTVDMTHPPIGISPVPPPDVVVVFDLVTGELFIDGVLAATWDNGVWIAVTGSIYTVTGMPEFSPQTISAVITPAPALDVQVSFAMDTNVDIIDPFCKRFIHHHG